MLHIAEKHITAVVEANKSMTARRSGRWVSFCVILMVVAWFSLSPDGKLSSSASVENRPNRSEELSEPPSSQRLAPPAETIFAFPSRTTLNSSIKARILRYLNSAMNGSTERVGIGYNWKLTNLTMFHHSMEWNRGQVSTTALEFLACTRDWLFDHVEAAVSGKYIPPRFRMGEVRTWTSLLRSLASLNCHVTFSKACGELGGWGHNQSERQRRIFLTEDLSLFHLKRLARQHGSVICRQRASQTVAVAGQRSKIVPNQRVVPLFHIAEHNRSLGLIVDHQPARKAWYVVLWGKSKQNTPSVTDAVRELSKIIPVVSNCLLQCSESLNAAQLTDTRRFAELVRNAAVLVGVNAPEVGALVPEALAAQTFVIARGRNLGFEFAAHPLTRRFRNPKTVPSLVLDILKQLGFDPTRPFDQQLSAPNLKHLENVKLPLRYTITGHAAHIAEVFGISSNGTCHVTTGSTALNVAASHTWTPSECT